VLVSIVREHMLPQFALFVSSYSSVRKMNQRRMNGAYTALRLTVTVLTSLTRECEFLPCWRDTLKI